MFSLMINWNSTSSDRLCSKVSLSIGVMMRILHLIPVDVLRNLYYTLIYSRFTSAITAWGSAFNSTTRRLESLIPRAITLITDQSNTNRLQISPKFIPLKGVCDHFVLCKIFNIIFEWKYEHFTQNIDNQLIVLKRETRSRINNKLALPRYSKSKCQNAHIFRGMKLWNTNQNHIKYSANLNIFKKYLKHFILSSLDSPYWYFQMVLIHSYVTNYQIITWSSFHKSYFLNCIFC